MKIDLDLEKFRKADLTLPEYTALSIIASGNKQLREYLQHLGMVDYNELQLRGWLKFNHTKNTVVLREKALKLFRLDPDVFKEFFETYPQRTPSGRNLRTTRAGTNEYRVALEKWTKLFKTKPEEAVEALQALKNEIAYRSSLDEGVEYMVGIVKWIEDAHYERTYEVPKNKTNTSFTDFDEL